MPLQPLFERYHLMFLLCHVEHHLSWKYLSVKSNLERARDADNGQKLLLYKAINWLFSSIRNASTYDEPEPVESVNSIFLY